MDKASTQGGAQVDQIEERVRGAFLQLALEMGGAFAEHPIQDEMVFALCRFVDGAFTACLAPLADLRTPGERQPPALSLRRHPAILHLLNVIETKQ